MKKKTKAKGKKSCEFRFCLLNWRPIKGSGVIPRKLLKTKEVWFHRRDDEIIHLCTVKLWESASLSSRWDAPGLPGGIIGLLKQSKLVDTESLGTR